MSDVRVLPCTMTRPDGSHVDALCTVERTDEGVSVHDLRDLDGRPVVLLPGARIWFETGEAV